MEIKNGLVFRVKGKSEMYIFIGPKDFEDDGADIRAKWFCADFSSDNDGCAEWLEDDIKAHFRTGQWEEVFNIFDISQEVLGVLGK